MAVLLAGCSTASIQSPTAAKALELPKSYALEPQEDGGFTSIEKTLRDSYEPDQSGFMLIKKNGDGLRWRLALVDQAKHSLDLQYYLWYLDDSGRILPHHLYQAAERGVRIRGIVDDLLVIDKDPFLNLLAAHPNFEEIVILNPYLIPADSALAKIKEITGRGVTIRILTNSLESNDVPAVNSHYQVWRKPLVEAGVKLYEIRADAAIQSTIVDTHPVTAEFMGLHAKAVVVDRRYLFIGSMNLDPRSTKINTEMGVLIDSPQLGAQLEQLIASYMAPENSWQLSLDEDGDLIWISSEGTETSQPARNFRQRVQDSFFKLFPKEYY